MKKPRVEVARAVLRLAAEELVPVERLCARTTASARALVRWITAGRGGVFLDGVHRPGVGWMSSAEALGRFFAALEARPGADPAAVARLRADAS